ncbi:MAG: acetylxylan esterase, partial [Planctomycetales bacterium]|nr:acetylxylan esterase [Planctomycetales bacterium]
MFLRNVVAFAIALAILLRAASSGAMTDEERRDYRENLLKTLPSAPEFEAWLGLTDELPPDFDALPRSNALPDPLQFIDGRRVTTHDEWQERRAEILQLFEKYMFGTLPPAPNIANVEVAETPHENYSLRDVTLHYGREGKAVMHLSMLIPQADGPLPTVIGPSLIGGFGNAAEVLLNRGYVTVSFAGSDFHDDTSVLPSLYPDFDFAKLPRRAWSIKAILNYLETVPQVDMDRVAVYGYSRDGKMATIAAAIDERIKGVVAGSTGVGGTLPFRLAGELNHAESIESTTRMFPDWFHPRLRYFSGREDRLPVDGNLLVALIAPRACLIHFNRNDEVGNTFGNEAAFRNALQLYAWLGASDKVGMLRRPGFHSSGIDLHAAVDFLDIAFGRSSATWHNDALFDWNWEAWRDRYGDSVDSVTPRDRFDGELLADDQGPIVSLDRWASKASAIKSTVQSALGTPPLQLDASNDARLRGRQFSPRAPASDGPDPGQLGPDVDAWVIRRGSGEFGWTREFNAHARRRTVRFNHVSGQLYLPADAPDDARLPTVVFLHGRSYPLGYMWVYRRDMHPILALAKEGFAVLAFDQTGFGSRMDETRSFYDRYPQWSRMGRMVQDVSAAIDVLQAEPQVD